MIQPEDIDEVLRRPGRDRETIEDWCERHNVDEAVIHQLVSLYGYNKQTAVVAIDAFRLAHEACERDELLSQSLAPTSRAGQQA